ncbi:RNA-directed DNA polymerase, eukaryota [Tanacetum coccineum]
MNETRAEYSECREKRLRNHPITKFKYHIENVSKKANMTLIINHQSVNFEVYTDFKLKMLEFTEWSELYDLTFKKSRVHSLQAKIKWSKLDQVVITLAFRDKGQEFDLHSLQSRMSFSTFGRTGNNLSTLGRGIAVYVSTSPIDHATILGLIIYGLGLLDPFGRTFDFSVKSTREFIDDSMLPKTDVPTRWVKSIPIKINIFAWRVSLDKLPTRLNLSLRGLDIPSIICPLCSIAVESTSHLLFSCQLARQLMIKVVHWWELEYQDFHSYED